MKAIVESFVDFGILITQAKVSLQKSGLAGQLLKIKDRYECLVKLIEKIENEYHMLQTFLLTKKLFHVEKTVGQAQEF